LLTGDGFFVYSANAIIRELPIVGGWSFSLQIGCDWGLRNVYPYCSASGEARRDVVARGLPDFWDSEREQRASGWMTKQPKQGARPTTMCHVVVLRAARAAQPRRGSS